MKNYHLKVMTYYELQAKNDKQALEKFENLTYEDLANLEVEDTESVLFTDDWEEVDE